MENIKLNIDITSEELQKILQHKVKEAIAEHIASYSSTLYIRERVKTLWTSTVDTIVNEALKDSEMLRSKITAELEKKLRAQLAIALKTPKY